MTKHIFVTGGVASSLGKGLTASSLGRLLKLGGPQTPVAVRYTDRPGEAIAQFDHVVQKAPDDAAALRGLGSALAMSAPSRATKARTPVWALPAAVGVGVAA